MQDLSRTISEKLLPRVVQPGQYIGRETNARCADGESAEEAEGKKKEYEGNEFEVRVFEKEGKHLVYTRRVVKEVIVEGAPPA